MIEVQRNFKMGLCGRERIFKQKEKNVPYCWQKNKDLQ